MRLRYAGAEALASRKLLVGSAASVLGIGEDRLSIYLNDHLAGATVGMNLARHIADRSTPFGALAEEIAQDRETLRDVMRRLGVSEDRVKVLLGWVGEHAAWLKFTGELLG